ncbi:MAG TPA: hypothetical protein VFS20_04755 [Longimicrobium sp.]|nr:hypothetical protein [Longimicrobium sp.]
MSQIIIRVLGPWRGRTELMEALARQGTDYMFAGLIFMEQSTQTTCEFDFTDHEPELRQRTEIIGQGKFSSDDLDAVERHSSTAWLIFDNAGYETARAAARFARALLEAGGVAVVVESAGVAHTRERWLRGWSSDDPWDIYSLFVILVGGQGRYFSCGMHNFALPDAAVAASLGTEEGARLLNEFNLYQMVESPVLNSGETFSLEADSPRFRLTRQAYEGGYEDTPMHNPHGLWSLQPAEAAPARKRWRWPF